MKAGAFLGVVLFSVIAVADILPGTIYRGDSGEKIKLNDTLEDVGPGTVVLLGERHDQAAHHQNQRDFWWPYLAPTFQLVWGWNFSTTFNSLWSIST